MRLWSLLAIALTACMGDMGMDMMIPDVIDVPASAGRFDTVAAVDLDPAPTVVEVALTARVADVELAPGHVTSMWTYDGTLPGPRIEANVGDTVKVRFTNSLPEPTTIHWHGVRVPAAMDGVEATQAPIAPGATFTYEFVVPDAGTFWFHPHVRSDVQVERGLYGTLVVRGPGEPATTSDRVVVLDDLLIALHLKNDALRSDLDRVLKQRNTLLKQAGGRLSDEVAFTLDVWDAKFAELGEATGRARAALIDAIRPGTERAYEELAGRATPVELEFAQVERPE